MTSKKIALLFAGQGAQSVGMGRDLVAASPGAAALIRKADEILGYPLSTFMFEGPVEELTRTSICQPALYVHGLACCAALYERLPSFDFAAAAGLSLGEFTAHAAAGTFDFEAGLRLVARRALAMQEACDATEGGMAAIIGAEENAVRDLTAAADVDIANLNCPGQIVISGESSKIALAVSLASEFGIRKARELQVAGAFHSRLMESAYDSLQTALEETAIETPSVPVICNVDAIPVTDSAMIRRTLADQVTGSVRWSESVEYLIDKLHCDLLVEVGPGGILAGLVNRIRKGTPVLSISNVATLDEAVQALA